MPEVTYRPKVGVPRTPANEEPAAERARDFRPVDTGYTKADAIAEAQPLPRLQKTPLHGGLPGRRAYPAVY